MSDKPDLLDWLRNRGLCEYGAHIKGDDVRAFLGIDMPELGTKADFDKAALAELGAMDLIRAELLQEGKYLTQTKGDYRIVLPSENANQIRSYMDAAQRKLGRAILLSENTPATDINPVSNVRLHMLADSLNASKRRTKLTGVDPTQ